MEYKNLRNNEIRRALIILFVLTAAVILLFLFWNLNMDIWEYALPRRGRRIAAIALTASAIGVSSLVFQTITNNNILTPSVMGLDSLYLFVQTFIVYTFGSQSLTMLTAYSDFFLSCGIMCIFSVFLFRAVFRRENSNIYILILTGMVCGSFFGSLSSFMQALIDPNEFLIVQGKMFASFSNVNTDLLKLSTGIIALCFAYVFVTAPRLDVMALGRDTSIGLGISYDKQILGYLLVISLLVSVATALIGPITFLGVIVVNLSRRLVQTYRHRMAMISTSLLGIIFLVGGQFMVEHVFKFNTTVSVIVNFVGGIYFIYLLFKAR